MTLMYMSITIPVVRTTKLGGCWLKLTFHWDQRWMREESIEMSYSVIWQPFHVMSWRIIHWGSPMRASDITGHSADHRSLLIWSHIRLRLVISWDGTPGSIQAQLSRHSWALHIGSSESPARESEGSSKMPPRVEGQNWPLLKTGI